MKLIDPKGIRIDITKEVAKELGFVETIYVKNTKYCFSSKLNLTREVQAFDYLIVIDFESTCWKEKNVAWKQPEIIEFPAVLLNARNGVVEEEFQQYVMPIENKILSEFCVKFTGIQQEQVDNGVPLGTCLLLFTNWINRISGERNITFHKADPGKFACTFVTWSDWDLGMCLHNECQRKNIKKPEMFCQWIDLKAVYKEFYQRNPRGLRGALSEVGLNFEGREHSGLSDAKNTAYLAWQMIQHGAELRITKVLQPVKKISSSVKTSLQTTLKNHFVVSKNISKRKTLNTSDDKENIPVEAKDEVLSSKEVTTPLTSRQNTLLKFQSSELKGRISVVSGVAGRSHNLVFLLRGDILSSLLGQPKPNEEVAETFPTKGGGLLSLIGSTGEVAWWKRLYHLPHDIDCSLMDVTDDGINDCIVVGAESLLVTVDPLSGAIIWHVHNHTREDMNAVNMSFPLILPDLDGDSLNELLATCSLSEKNSSGYNLVSEPKVSLHNYMILISGKTGRFLGHPLEMNHCSKISSLVLESDGNVSYTCQDFKGKDSTNIILIQELYTKATLKPLPSNINLTQFKNQSLKQHVILNRYKVGGRRLTLENLGHCPSHCNTTVRIFDERASHVNEMVWNHTGENTYAMIPASLTFSKRSTIPGGDTAFDQVSGFVLKLWQWNTANIRHVSVEGNSQDESSTKPLYRNRLRREITSETWARLQDYRNSSTRTSRSVQPPFTQNLKCPTLSNMTIHQLNERVVLITFNATDMHIVNTSQSDITQLCTRPETAGEHPTCQPDLAFQEQSLLIADLDRDGSQELISYLTTFVMNKDVDSAAVWKLQSKVRVIRLESELPKLYEAVTQQ